MTSKKLNTFQETKNKISLDDIEMPNSKELEDAVLGAILIDKDAFIMVNHILPSLEVFYSLKNEIIFKSCRTLFDLQMPIDIRTVTNELRKTKELEFVGGAYYVSQLTYTIQSAANIEYHARILLQFWMRREMIKINLLNKGKLYDLNEDIFTVIDKNISDIYNISEKISSKNAVSAKEMLETTLKKIEKDFQKNGITGVPAGINALDKITGGFQNSDLIIIAGRPGMGKTSLALQIAKNASLKHKKNVTFFSLEMSNHQLMVKLISSETAFTTSEITRGLINDEKFSEIVNKSQILYTENLRIDDTAGCTIQNIISKAVLEKYKYKTELIIIDYLQLLSNPEKKTREQEIGSISMGLKQLAKLLDMPVIALSQLSRATETRSTKKPQLSDLRDSGSIEQDADVVIFPYRPEYYDIETTENGESTKNLMELIIEKHRNGVTGSVSVYCNMGKNEIKDFEETIFVKNENYIDPMTTMRGSLDFSLPLSEQKDVPF